jgi:hypothetical protein
MSTTVMTLVALTAAGLAPAAAGPVAREDPGGAAARLDKTGTAGGVPPGAASQTQGSQPLTAAGSLLAERAGFSDGRPAADPRLKQLPKG